MFKLGRLAFIFAIATLSSVNAASWDCCEEPALNEPSYSFEQPSCNRFYIGGFGGGIYSKSSKIQQYGTAFFTEAAGGPLSVIAKGHLNKISTGFGGVQMGYEWYQPSCSSWSLSYAGEVEAFFFKHKKHGQ